MKSFFDENHRYNDHAITLSSEFSKSIMDLYTKYIEMGYSPREIAHVMQLELFDIEIGFVLERS